MRIESLRLKNFRAFRDAEWKNIPPFAVIVGANGTGKSTLFKVFEFLRDQDSGDCLRIKEDLKRLCLQAGRPDAVVRIVCRELESWYLGDLAAVEAALDLKGLARRGEVSKFRSPDRLDNAAAELTLLTQGEYRKISGSRRLGHVLSLNGSNRSASFGQFCQAVRRLAQAA